MKRYEFVSVYAVPINTAVYAVPPVENTYNTPGAPMEADIKQLHHEIQELKDLLSKLRERVDEALKNSHPPMG